MTGESLFCYPMLGDEEYLAYLEAAYAESCHDPAFARELTPLETIATPERSVRTRLDILKCVYAGEYFTDSFDVERLSARVRAFSEFIWIWGRTEMVEGWLDAAGDESSKSDLELGTVSVVAAGPEFDPGMAEICRSGSRSPVMLKPYAIKRIIDYLTGRIPALHESFHTLFLVPRVRAAAEGIRGGKSVNTIHRKYIRSRFWGFAPWYVMQGGFLECLEYREVNRSRQDLIGGMRAMPSIYLADSADRAFAQALFGLNLANDAGGMTFPPAAGKREPAAPIFRQVYSTGEAIQLQNHRTHEQICEGDGTASPVTLETIQADLKRCACNVITLDISRPDSWGVQRMLHDDGYRLTCIRPPRLVGSQLLPGRGSWAKPNPFWTVAPPFYAGRSATDIREQIVLQHLAGLLDHWTI